MVGVFYYGGCFCIPFLLEIVLYVISFLMEAKNDFYHLGIYEPEYAQKVHRYLGGRSLYCLTRTLCGCNGSAFRSAFGAFGHASRSGFAGGAGEIQNVPVPTGLSAAECDKLYSEYAQEEGFRE